MRIDLNADLGEGFGQWRLTEDDALLAVVTSANVACGFHAGDASTMRRVCAAAVAGAVAGGVAGGVAIGAQVSYRDLAGFGRREMDYAPGELADEVLYQLAALDGLARVEGGRVTYLKPHGALYHRCGRDERQAGAVVAAVRAYDPALAVLGAPGSALLRLAGEAGLRAVPEAFADRAYTAAGTLVPRTEPGAVLTDPDRVIAQAVRLVTEGAVDAVTGDRVEVRAESLCLHGDTPGAVDLARRVRAALGAAGVEVAPFVET